MPAAVSFGGVLNNRLTGVNYFFRSTTIISAGCQTLRFPDFGGSEIPTRPEISSPARSSKGA